MSDAKRYELCDPTGEAYMADDYPRGEYVRSVDYDARCAEIEQLRAEVAELQRKLRGADAFERSVNEALNSGDGAYRP